MRAALERWAQLEPERCMIGPPTSHICAVVQVGNDTHADAHTVTFDRPSAKQQALLLAAVLDAVTARAWTCSLTNNVHHRYAWRATVWASTALPGTRTYRPSHVGDASIPAEALLRAYVKALEAEREVTP